MSLFDLNFASISREAAEQMADQETEQKLNEEIENVGKAVREKEHTVYARILDFSQLKKADKAEIQEQYIIPVERTEENRGSGKIRIRKVTSRSGDVRYELTTKSDVKEGKIEVTVPTTEENFIQFKVMASVSMFKHRYTFTDEGSGLKWEVDAVPDGNGGYYPWVRAEIEVKDLKDKVPEFPIKTEEIIYPPELSETSEEEYKEKTDKLNSRFFVKGNVYLDDDKAQNNTELKGDADKVVETKPESEDTPDADEADKEKDAKASLSVDNITDDKEKAEKVETRGEQIKEAREEVEGPDEDSGDGEEATTDTEETDSDEGESESEGEEESGKEDSGEEDKGEKEGDKEPGWDEPAKDDKEVSKESFDNYGKNYDTNGQVDINGIVEVSTETEEQPTGIADETFNFITSEISQEMRK
jgi:30 kDa salivary gland allergen aed a 3